MALYVVREGDGEKAALPVLVYAIRNHVGLDRLPHHSPDKHSWKKPLITQANVEAVCEQLRATADCEAVLLTRDADQDQLPYNDCPKFTAPEIGDWVRALNLPFPVAVVLFYKEYETLFLSGADAMAGKTVNDAHGRPIAEIPATATAHPDPEHPRDAKGWVKKKLFPVYKETLYQHTLTRLLDHDDLSNKGLSSYRRLVSALEFLATNQGVAGAVYPPTPAGGP